ncbi:MAG: hypothetical protein Q7T56_13200 [Nocardioidaceae bacterium]|nr:hypothetical protein [Nocardioidaceae bacterium]
MTPHSLGRRRRDGRWLLVAPVVLTLALAACSGGGDDPPEPVPTTTTTTSAPRPTAQAAGPEQSPDQVAAAVGSLSIGDLLRTEPLDGVPPQVVVCPGGPVLSADEGATVATTHFGSPSEAVAVVTLVYPDAAAATAAVEPTLAAVDDCTATGQIDGVPLEPVTHGRTEVDGTATGFVVVQGDDPVAPYQHRSVAQVGNVVLGVVTSGRSPEQVERQAAASLPDVLTAITPAS